MPRVKLVIFDLESTTHNNLVKGIPLEIQSILQTLKNHNKEISIESFKRDYLGNPINYLKNFSENSFSKLEKDYLQFLRSNSENWKENEGIWEITQWLRIHDVKVSLVSALPALIVNDILDKMGWRKGEAYDYWTCSELVDEWRPSPIMIRRSMRYNHIRSVDEVIKVSSYPWGIKEGKNAGVLTFAIKSSWFREDELKESMPDAYFQNFKEMLGWMKLENLV